MNQVNPGERRPRLLIADDHALFRERVAALLNERFELVGAVSNGAELLKESEHLAPDVIVLDITMPKVNGIEAARELRKRNCPAKLVFLTVHDQKQFVRRCLAEGAMAYVVKSRLETDLIPAILNALSEQRFLSPPVAR